MILALSYAIGGVLLCIGSMIAMTLMYLSGTFLPTYIGGEFNPLNQILRDVLYLILSAVIIATGLLSGYGFKYLDKRYYESKERHL